MTSDLTLEDGGCAFELSNWDMEMSVPDGGTLRGTRVTLSGEGTWAECTGAVDSNSIHGECADGCTFHMLPSAP